MEPSGEGGTAGGPRLGFPAVSFRTGAELVAAVILLASLAVTSHRLTQANKRAGASALEADTLRATIDTTKRIALRADSTRSAVQRQAVQVVAARADSIDRELKLERIAKTVLVARIDTLTIRVASVAPVEETKEGERSAAFVVDSTPYHIRAEVYMPAPPEAATIQLTAALDSVPLEIRHGCGPENTAGIRSAYVTVIGPKWAALSIGRVEQDPALCHSSALEPAHGDGRSTFRKIVDRFGVSAGVSARTLKPDVLVGFKVWP